MRQADDQLNLVEDRGNRHLKVDETNKGSFERRLTSKDQAVNKKQARKERKKQANLTKKSKSENIDIEPPSANADGTILREDFKRLSNDELIVLAEECVSEGVFIKALGLYSFAGDRGSLDALFKSGGLYASGSLGVKDHEAAFRCYLSAAKRGYVPAMEVVAQSYFSGVGVEKNKMKSAAFIFAAYGLEPDTVRETYNTLVGRIHSDTFKAGKAHASFSFFMTNKNVSKGVERPLTKESQRKIAINKSMEAKSELGMIEGGLTNSRCYEGLSNEVLIGSGEAFERLGEFFAARDIYLVAEERGSLDALIKLSELSESGNLGAKDFVSSFELLLSAAKRGHIPAMELVAHNYYLGLGVGKDEMRCAAIIIAAHEIDPDMVTGSFYKLKRLIDSDVFEQGRALSHYWLEKANTEEVKALSRVNKHEPIRVGEKPEMRLKVVKESNSNKPISSNDEDMPVGFMLVLVVLMVFVFYIATKS